MPEDQITPADVTLLRRGLTIGNRAVVETIECECVGVDLAEPGKWYDTRPMLDEREHAPQIIDMARESLDYALDAGLVRRHSQQPHLVCVLWQG